MRKQANTCLRDVLQSFQGIPSLIPASEGITNTLERFLLLAGGSNTNETEGPRGAQEVLFVLDTLKECLPLMSMKCKTTILKYYKTLLELRQPVVTRRITDSLNVICLHMTSDVSAEALLDLLCSLALSASTNETSVGPDFLPSAFLFVLIWSTPCLIKISSMQLVIKLFNASIAAKMASSCSEAKISDKPKVTKKQDYSVVAVMPIKLGKKKGQYYLSN